MEGDFLSASTDVYSQKAAAETERYSAALLKIPADDLEVTVQDTQIKFLHNLSTAVEDSECSEQVRKAVKDSVRDEGHAGDGESGENFRGDFSRTTRSHRPRRTKVIVRHFLGTVRWSVQLKRQRQRRLAASHLRVQLRLLHTALSSMIVRAVRR